MASRIVGEWKEQRRERELIADCDNRKLYAQQLLCQQIGRDHEQGLMECLEETGWGLQQVNIVVGTRSVKTEKWNEAMEKLVMPKAVYMG